MPGVQFLVAGTHIAAPIVNMMEIGEANFRTPFSGEQVRQVQPLSDAKREHDIRSSPDVEPIENMSITTTTTTTETQVPNVNQTSGVTLGGAASVQQPKVQTAFIHKLYKYVMPTVLSRNC